MFQTQISLKEHTVVQVYAPDINKVNLFNHSKINRPSTMQNDCCDIGYIGLMLSIEDFSLDCGCQDCGWHQPCLSALIHI